MAEECTAIPNGEDEPSGTRKLPELVVITGLSGAGRSEAIHTFEDLGYFCIDNLPPTFIPQIVDLARLPGSRIRRIAVVCDVRAKEFFDQLSGELAHLEESGVPFTLLFLEADEETLVRRFKETRRRHPMCDEGESVSAGIHAEQELLADLRGAADIVVDTSALTPRQLRNIITEAFASGPATSLSVTVTSFGFKYGLPSDADIVMDVRFLPNPHYDPALRPHSGLDEPVRDFVLGRDETSHFLEKWFDLLAVLAPAYLAEGKSHLSVALGCTGGMHRSVALAEETASYLRDLGYRAAVTHRDIGKDRERQ